MGTARAYRQALGYDGTTDELLRTYRAYAVIAGVLIPLFWIIYRVSDPAAFDPLWLRLLLAAITFGLLGLSYVSPAVRDRFVVLMHGLLYLFTAWFVLLSGLNAFSPNYAVGLLFVIAAIAVAISTGLRQLGPLRAYVIFAVVLTSVVVLTVPEEISGVIGPFIFIGCVASIGLVIHVAAAATIRAQSALRTSERKYRTLFASANDAILIVDPAEGAVLEANRKALDMYGFSEEELTGFRVDDLASEPWLKAAPVENLEVTHRTRDGRPLHVLASTAEIDYEARTAYLIIIRDVTERMQTLETLSRANAALRQRNRDLQDFTTAASHDLQEPVRKIRTFADLARKEYVGRIEEPKYLVRIQDIGAQMSQIIADLVTFSRVASGEEDFRSVDLDDIVREVLNDLAAEIAEATVTVEMGDVPQIEAVPSQMHELLRHLVANAVDARRPDVPLQVRIAADAADGYCRVAVSDNGVGIHPKHFERIFSPFQHLKSSRPKRRTGMGLAICKRIAEHHGGTLRLESTVGEGSTFIVELPCRW